MTKIKATTSASGMTLLRCSTIDERRSESGSAHGRQPGKRGRADAEQGQD
jgi:hypothetical protein